MKDTTVLARCNLYAVLGAIPHLLRLDPIAAELVRDKHIKIGFSVKSGPKGMLILKDGTAELVKGTDYTVKYTNNKAVGTAKATITGTANTDPAVSAYSFTISRP